tara:strand:- start:1904 stop:2086 length:183 start_codon:yes stop_codon:yes gene_type:complete
MKTGDIVYGENQRQWKLVSDNGGGMFLAHVVTSEAAHIKGISPPLHLVSAKHMSEVLTDG